MVRAKPSRAPQRRNVEKDRSKEQRVTPASHLTPERKHLYQAICVLTAAVFLCFVDSLWNGFVFDDHMHLLEPRLLRSLANLPRFLMNERPLRDASYALDFAIWGERSMGFHLTNILIHWVNTVLVFILLRRFVKDALPAALGALVFAIHPMQSDTVAYVSGRRDLLFSFFYLSAFLSYLAYRSRLAIGKGKRVRAPGTRLWFALVLICWVLGLLSKQMAASFPIVVFAWALCEEWPNDRNVAWWRRGSTSLRDAVMRDKWLYVFCLTLLPLYTAYTVLARSSLRASGSGFKYWGGSFYRNALTALRVHAWYLKQLVWPTPTVQYSGAFDVSSSLLEWRVILATIVVGATIAAGLILLDKDKRIAFAVLSYFIILLPVSQIIPHHELLADHYLYLPLMSFGLLIAVGTQWVFARGVTSKRLACAVVGALLLTFGVLTALRNRVYKDDLTLWETNCREAPNSTRALSSLASLYARTNPAKAAELCKRCITVDRSYAAAYVSLALLSKTKDEARETEEIVSEGLALPDSAIVSPGYENPRRFRADMKTALAVTKAIQGDEKEAENLLLEAIDLSPVFKQPYELLAHYYHKTDPSKEIAILQREIDALEFPYEPLQDISGRLMEQKKFDEALPYLKRTLALVPNDFYANYQLSQVYGIKRDCARAKEYLSSAQSLAENPDDVKAVQDGWRQFRRACQ